MAALFSAAAQVPDTLKRTLPAPVSGGGQSGANLGASVAVDGEFTVAGAPFDDLFGSDSGAVKVFDSSTGALRYVIPNPAPAANDWFGIAVAISGTRVVVGASLDDTGASGAGMVYVYDLSGPTPTLPVATLPNPSPDEGDQFGKAVAISGTRVVVGAPFDDTAALDAGSAYVYDFTGGTPTGPERTLHNPTPGEGDQFGGAVGISGLRIVVGAAFDDPSASNAGSAVVYDLGSATPEVPTLTLENPTPTTNEQFARAVAISGTRVVIGATGDDTTGTDSGIAYVYDTASPTATVPVETFPNPTPAAIDSYGSAVAISGTKVVVSASADDAGASNAGSAYLYDLAGAIRTDVVATFHNPSPGVNDSFGGAVALSGGKLVVGASTDDTGATDAGSAYLYDVLGGTPSVPLATLNNPGPSSTDQFGSAVAISGMRVVVGAYQDDTLATNAGVVYVYDLASAMPTTPIATLNNPTPAANDQFGRSVGISGTLVVVGASGDDTGATDGGIAYVYDLSSATPAVPAYTLLNPAPGLADLFGAAVAISGMRVVVGAYQDDSAVLNGGSVFVYDISGPPPSVSVRTLNNPTPVAQDWFGYAVAIDGDRVVVGARFDDSGGTDSGGAHVYDLAGGTPETALVTLPNPDPGSADWFGAAVAISGTRIVVGANGDDTGTIDAGSAYVFDLSSGTNTVPVATLNNPSPGASDSFGLAVGISGTRVVVGAYQDDTAGDNAGSVYVYDLGSGPLMNPVATLGNPGPTAPAGFGFAVAIDGTTAAIGSPFDSSVLAAKGIAYIFAPADTAPPTGGTFAVTPASPTNAATLTATFAGWTDASPPLTYSVRNGATVIVPPGSSAAPTFPLAEGSHTLTGRIADCFGNSTDSAPVTVVVDRTAPVITTPGAVAVHATSPAGAVVEFTPTATDGLAVQSLVSVPASGSLFPNGPTNVTVTATDSAGNVSTAQFTVTVTPLTTVELWRYENFGAAVQTGVFANGGDADSDRVPNFIEFAFGTDPMAVGSGTRELGYAGTFAGGGTLTRRGQPVVRGSAGDFRVLYVRRADFATVGLGYVVEFSADAATWEAGGGAPTVLATDGVCEVIGVSFPPTVAGRPARFARVQVTLAP